MQRLLRRLPGYEQHCAAANAIEATGNVARELKRSGSSIAYIPKPLSKALPSYHCPRAAMPHVARLLCASALVLTLALVVAGEWSARFCAAANSLRFVDSSSRQNNLQLRQRVQRASPRWPASRTPVPYRPTQRTRTWCAPATTAADAIATAAPNPGPAARPPRPSHVARAPPVFQPPAPPASRQAVSATAPRSPSRSHVGEGKPSARGVAAWHSVAGSVSSV
ncbi:hypothetical protein HaLaN_19809 [Haematococcus lacustris]|uniref:Uncharacterized protein n=1 Tax=Haematococcus lacustris TaxID=44745 RepID=A0A699ZUG2_HAELA|nr:hypothetical protein HaLaN_19809 [Haematococcus lacustris]